MLNINYGIRQNVKDINHNFENILDIKKTEVIKLLPFQKFLN